MITTPSFTAQEQSLLDAAAVELVMAQQKLQQAQTQIEELRHGATNAAGKLQGALHTMLSMKGVNPAAFSAIWDSAQECVVVSPV